MSEIVSPPVAEPAPTAVTAPAADTAQLLKQLFPALFSGPRKPLKLRIQVDIQARAPGRFTKQALSAFFRRHTGSTSYLTAVGKMPHRFDLDGQPAGEISAEHRQAALDELARRRAQHDERRRIEEQQRGNRAALLRAFQTTTLTPANFCALKGVAVAELDGLLEIARQEAAARPRPMPPVRPAPGERPAGDRPTRGEARAGSPSGRPGEPPRGDPRRGR